MSINVLSLFDGISVGKVALEREGIKVGNYYASEIDENAMKISKKNHPDIIQLGDVTQLTEEELFKLPKIDLLIGGSPCQDISLAKRSKSAGLEGEKSKLFFEYLRILEWLKIHNNKDIKFLLENVKGKKDDIDAISEFMNVQPVLINSELVSAQVRKRNYWTNISHNIIQPVNRNIKLEDVLESGFTEKDKSFCLTATYGNACVQNYFLKSERQHIFTKEVERIKIVGGYKYIVNDEIVEIITGKDAKFNRANLDKLKEHTRKLTPIECERLQTLPDGYTEGISTYERYRCLGNGWTAEVISHIFSYLEVSEYIESENTIIKAVSNT